MNADSRRWLSMIAAVMVPVLGTATFAMEDMIAPQEIKYISDDLLWDEIAQPDKSKPATHQAEEFPWQFELTSQIMRNECSRLRSRSVFDFDACECQEAKIAEPSQFHWEYELSQRMLHRSYPYGDAPMTFGGVGFQR